MRRKGVGVWKNIQGARVSSYARSTSNKKCNEPSCSILPRVKTIKPSLLISRNANLSILVREERRKKKRLEPILLIHTYSEASD